MASSGKKTFIGWFLTALVLTIIALVITLIATAVHRVNTNSIGIFYDTYAKEFVSVHTQGLYGSRPFTKVITFTATYEQIDINAKCVTNDGLNVTLSTTFQYVPDPTVIKSIAYKFVNAKDYLDIVTTVATAAIHQTCSQYQITDFQNIRPLIQSSLSDNLNTFLLQVNASALAAQLTNVNVPSDWNNAVYSKQQADQDISLANNQRAQILYLAQNNVSIAEQTATVALQNANANVTVINLTAEQQAEAIQSQYSSFTVVCETLIKTLGINAAGLISLLNNRIIGTSQNSLDINMM